MSAADDPADAPSPHPDPRVAGWTAPAADADPRARSGDVPGALGGSRLFEQPQYRAEVERFDSFINPPGPVAVEIGFDHGRRLRSLAEAGPAVRWVGMEVRQARVEALAEAIVDGPGNLLPWRVDARIVFRRLMPAGRLARVDVVFPTPWWHGSRRAKRLLLGPPFIADVARALAPDGILHIATDVGPYFAHVEGLLADWQRVTDPPPAPVPSRREHTCAREGIPVDRGTWRPPPA